MRGIPTTGPYCSAWPRRGRSSRNRPKRWNATSSAAKAPSRIDSRHARLGLGRPSSALPARPVANLGPIRPAFRLFDGGIEALIRRCMELPERVGGFRNRDPPALRRAKNVQQNFAIFDRAVIDRSRRFGRTAAAIRLNFLAWAAPAGMAGLSAGRTGPASDTLLVIGPPV